MDHAVIVGLHFQNPYNYRWLIMRFIYRLTVKISWFGVVVFFGNLDQNEEVKVRGIVALYDVPLQLWLHTVKSHKQFKFSCFSASNLQQKQTTTSSLELHQSLFHVQ